MTLFAREPPGPFGTYGGRALCTDSLAHARSTKPGYRAPLVCQHAATREHADRWTGEGDPLVQHGQDERVQRNKERRSRRRTSMPLVAIASLCLLASVLAAEAQPPDATLTGHGCNRSHNSTCKLSSFRTLTRFKTLAICCLNRRPCR